MSRGQPSERWWRERRRRRRRPILQAEEDEEAEANEERFDVGDLDHISKFDEYWEEYMDSEGENDHLYVGSDEDD